MNFPEFPMWLMNRFGVDDALAGDLAEQADRSPWWFWRQAAGSILIAVGRDLRAHWVLTLRAIFVGFVLASLLQTLQLWLWSLVSTRFWSIASAMELRQAYIHGTTAANTLLAMPGSFCIGWLVARGHQTRTPAPVLAFLVTAWCLAVPDYSQQFNNALGDPRFRPYLTMQLIGIVAFTVSVMAGGLWRRTVPGSV